MLLQSHNVISSQHEVPSHNPPDRVQAYVPVYSPAAIGDPPLKGSLHRRVRELLTITPPRILHEPPDNAAGTDIHGCTHIHVPVCDRLWEQRSVLARNVESVWSMCNRISQPLIWSTNCFSVFFTLFMRFFVAADLIDNRKLRSAQTNVHTLSRWYILIIYCVPVTGDSPWSTIQRILSLLFSLSLSLILSLRNRYYSREYVNVSQRDAFLRRRNWQWTRRRAWTLSRCMSITYDRYDMYAHDIVAFFFCMISHYALTVKKKIF